MKEISSYKALYTVSIVVLPYLFPIAAAYACNEIIASSASLVTASRQIVSGPSIGLIAVVRFAAFNT